jgi:glucose/arabinose dehydrogenase
MRLAVSPWRRAMGAIVCTAIALAAAPVARAGYPIAVPTATSQPATGERGPGVPDFVVRSGLKVTLVASNFGSPNFKADDTRFIEFDDHGTLYLSMPRSKCIATFHLQPDGTYKRGDNFVDNLEHLHGLFFKDGWMWFTQSEAVWKGRIDPTHDKAAETVRLVDNLPTGGHWWRSILVTDDAFYTSIGDPGNITAVDDSPDPKIHDREKIWKYSLDGKTRDLFVSGIRNTEKLRVRPGTNDIYGCDHGSDQYGAPDAKGHNLPDALKWGGDAVTDWNPPDEFNLYQQGGFYGHPFIVGFREVRPEYLDRPDIMELAAKTIPPVWGVGPHWATNGWCFLTKDSPLGKRGDAVIACHGSWNSSTKVGYRVEKVMFDPETNKPYGSLYLVKTIPAGGHDELDRPVDVTEAPDGSLLFSVDSNGGRIYRIAAAGATP